MQGLEMKTHVLNGIFAVNKPAGVSSAQCLDLVKHKLRTALGLTKIKNKQNIVKLGHGGTLDPMAEGVLVVGVGDGCKRLTGFLSGNKEYRFDLLLGTHYDTFDITGKPLESAEYNQVTEESVLEVLPKFTGDIVQKPPSYSALRIDGKRAYDLARKGQEVELAARPIRIDSLTLDSFSTPTLSFTAQVGGGCYIRSLCVDMAEALGTKGAMSKLIRSRQGQFSLPACLSIEDCEDLEKVKSVLQ